MSNESNVRSPLSWLLALAVPIVAVGGVLFGVIVLGRLAREHLGDQVRIEFKEIEVIPPPGIAREDFLDDVKNYADHAREPIPESIDPSDEPVKKLLAVFVCHPLVEEVIAIKILPERRIRVQLRYRTPVLSVEQNGTKRAVDKRGFRLPDTVPTEGLPVLRKAKAPQGQAGTSWGDERVTAAARTAAFLHDNEDQLAVTAIEGSADKLVLTTASGAKIEWGHAPGSEVAGEETAQEKHDRLLKR